MGQIKRHSDKEIIEALRANHGIVLRAANSLGYNADTLYHRIPKSPLLFQAMQDAREEILDLAEVVMVDKLKAGDADMAKFVLLHLGAQRGYVDETRFTANIMNVNANLNFDLKKLSLEELKQLEELRERITIDSPNISRNM